MRFWGRFHAFLTLLLAISGCVVPLGPQWQDPRSNAPPTISYANPPIGSILDFGANGDAALGVEVGLSDPDTADTLYALWIIDYPPYVDGESSLALAQTQPGGNQIERPHISFAPNCAEDAIASQDISQSSVALVSSGNQVEASWDFTINCP
jgi:hypothetical protein